MEKLTTSTDLEAEGYRFILADYNPILIQEWSKTPFDFFEGNILEVEAQCMLVPGNSFGIMQDGIEQVLLYHFGRDVERYLQGEIKKKFWKELFVGDSVGIPTNKEPVKELIYAPVYRVPQVIADPTQIYLAFRDAIDCAMTLGYKRIVFPGFGTQTGKVKEDWAVRMMSLAIEDAVNKKEFPKTLDEANKWHFQGYPK